MGGATEEPHTPPPPTFSTQEVAGAEVVGGTTGDPQLDGPLPVCACVWTVVGCRWDHVMPPHPPPRCLLLPVLRCSAWTRLQGSSLPSHPQDMISLAAAMP